MPTQRNVAIVVFHDVEVLDFAGPFEVFAVTGQRSDQPAPFNVFLTAPDPGPVIARNGLSVNPNFLLEECPRPDLVVVPGGMGTRREMNNRTIVEWVKTAAQEAELVLSVCTGALILAKAGLLDGLEATTHHNSFDLLRRTAPHTIVHEDRRFVDTGRVITSAGIAAGIDMSLHVVAKLLGPDQAAETAAHMEYPWTPSE